MLKITLEKQINHFNHSKELILHPFGLKVSSSSKENEKVHTKNHGSITLNT